MESGHSSLLIESPESTHSGHLTSNKAPRKNMSNFNLDTKIWRYLSFDKFIDLISTDHLYFSTPDNFDDTWECYPPAGFLIAENWKEKLIGNASMKDVNFDLLLENSVAGFEAAYYEESRYAFSCWSKSDRDHAALWNLYTDNKNGVAISTTPKALIESVIKENNVMSYLMVGCVEYLDFEDEKLPELSEPFYLFAEKGKPYGGITFFPFLYKRRSYAFEEEVRIIFHKVYEGSSLWQIEWIKFDLSMMIKDIIVAPNAKKPFLKIIRDLVKEKLPNTPINNSTLKFDRKISDRAKIYLEAKKLDKVVRHEKRAYPRGYIIFPNVEAFNVWHHEVCMKLGYPSIGINAITGAFAYNSGGTTGWCNPQKHPKDERILGVATPSIAFGNKLHSKDECEKLGWFTKDQN